MSIHMTARFCVRPNALDESKQAIIEFIDYVKANEPGTQLYASLNETDDETSFLHYFIFDDENSRNIHRNSEGVLFFTKQLYPCLIGDVKFTTFHLFATT